VAFSSRGIFDGFFSVKAFDGHRWRPSNRSEVLDQALRSWLRAVFAGCESFVSSIYDGGDGDY